MIHGGICGFSRLVVFLQASDNNRAGTVFDQFVQATARYGVPSPVRCDHGGENNTVCLFMNIYHGSERGSAIRGRSVHNQRIERLWRDLWWGMTNVYHQFSPFSRGMESLTVPMSDTCGHCIMCTFPGLTRTWRFSGNSGTIMDCALLVTTHHIRCLSEDVFRGKHHHSLPRQRFLDTDLLKMLQFLLWIGRKLLQFLLTNSVQPRHRCNNCRMWTFLQDLLVVQLLIHCN